MRTIIEAARKASPLVNEGFSDLKARLESFGQLVSDLRTVRSDLGREAMLEQCSLGLSKLFALLSDTARDWERFDSILGDYKYNFKKRKKGPPPDLAGQQVMEFNEKKDSYEQ